MLVELLYEALYSEHGVVVETDDVERLRQKLYPIRKQDPELQRLSLVVSPTNPQGELWIVKEKQDAES